MGDGLLRPMLDLASLGQRSPVSESVSHELLVAISSRGRRASEQDSRNKHSAPDILGILCGTHEENAHATQQDKAGPLFDSFLFDSYKVKLRTHLHECLEINKPPARPIKLLDRSSLLVVLSQLLVEQDIVLHRALLQHPFFEVGNRPSSTARRKRVRKKSSLLAEFDSAEALELYSNSIVSLVERAYEEHSLVAFLIAAKSLFTIGLCLQQQESLKAHEFVKGLTDGPLKKLARLRVPTQAQLVSSVQKAIDVVMLQKLGCRSAGHPSKYFLYGGTKKPELVDVQQEQYVEETQQKGNEGRKKKKTKRKSRRKRLHSRNDSELTAGGTGYEGDQSISELDDDGDDNSIPAPLVLIYGRSVVVDQQKATVALNPGCNLQNTQNIAIEHPDFRCDACSDAGPLKGQRFQCATCEGYDLCFTCFQNPGNHDLSHPFYLYSAPNQQRVLISPRNAVELSVVGIPTGVVSKIDQGAYFELTIVNELLRNFRVGWASVKSQLVNAIGTDDASCGTVFSQGFQDGDILGCGVDFEKGIVFYTHNGSLLEPKQVQLNQLLEAELFPCVSFLNNSSNGVLKWSLTKTFSPEIHPIGTFCKAFCLDIPRQAGAGALFFEKEEYVNCFKFHEDYTIEAMVRWVPTVYGTTVSCSNIYTILSVRRSMRSGRPSASNTSKTVSQHCTSFGIVGDGYLYLKRQNSDTISFTRNAVIVPGKWHHVSVTYYGGTYRSSSVFFSVDGISLKSDSRKQNLAKECDGPCTHKQNQWTIGGDVNLKSGETINQLSGQLADLRVWKKGLSNRELERISGRVMQVEPGMKKHLLIRFRMDESSGCRFVYNAPEAIADLHCSATLQTENTTLQTVQLPELDVDHTQRPHEINMALIIARRLAKTGAEVPSIILTILGHLTRLVNDLEKYNSREKQGCGIGVKISSLPYCVAPHVLTFLLLHSLLRQAFETIQDEEKNKRKSDEQMTVFWITSCLVGLLTANIRSMKGKSVLPSNVGLGPSPVGSTSNESNVCKLRRLLISILNFSADGANDSLKNSINVEILRSLAHGVYVFYPTLTEQKLLLISLLNPSSVLAKKHELQNDLPRLLTMRNVYLQLLCQVFANDSQLLGRLVMPETGISSSPSQASETTKSALKWPVQYVAASLNAKHSFVSESAAAAAANTSLNEENTVTKREVIRYMQTVAPSSWLETNGLDKNEMVVTKTFTSEKISAFYAQLEAQVSEGHMILGPPAIASEEDAKDPLELQREEDPCPDAVSFARILLEYISSPENTQAKHATLLLEQVQLFLQSPLNDSPTTSTLSTSSLLERFLWNGGVYIPEGEVKNNTGPTRTEAENWWADTIRASYAKCGENIYSTPVQLDSEKKSRFVHIAEDGVTCLHERNKNWGMVLAKKGYSSERNGSIHKWHVKINNCNSRGHLFVGVATKGVRIDSYLGNDRKSFGVLLAGDVYYDGQAKRRGVFKKGVFTAGCTIEMRLDIANRNLVMGTSVDSSSSGVNDVFFEFELPDFGSVATDGLIYPAICTYEQGDSATLVAYTATQVATGHWMVDSSRVSKTKYDKEFLAYAAMLLKYAARAANIDHLEQILVSAIAFVLTFPQFNENWVEQVEEPVSALFYSFSNKNKHGELRILLAVLAGRLCTALISSSPKDFENGIVKAADEEALFTTWCTSSLFTGGLRHSGCMFDTKGNEGIESTLKDEHSCKVLDLPKDVLDMINMKGSYKILYDWVLRHLQFNPSRMLAFGGAEMGKAVNGIIVSTLYHTGWLTVTREVGALLVQSKKAFLDFRPDSHLLDIWKSAMEIKAWLVRLEKDSDDQSGWVTKRVLLISRLLLDLEPCCTLKEIERVGVLNKLRRELGLPVEEKAGGLVQSVLGSVTGVGLLRGHDTDRPTFQTILTQVSGFFRDFAEGSSASVQRLHSRIISIRRSALRRRKGFRTLAKYLSNTPFSPSMMPVHAALLVVLPSTMRNWTHGKASNVTAWYYLDDLQSCGTKLLGSVSDSFSILGEALAKLLLAATVVGGSYAVGVQLALLDCWGIKLEAVDHELLSRTSLFETLHRIMEYSRDSIESIINGPSPESRNGEIMEMQLVGRAAMKAFYLLCSQVAGNPANHAEKLSFVPRSLVKMRSGPESLNSSVFNILFQEFRIAADQVLADPDQTQNMEREEETDDWRFMSEANHHLEEITSLLLSICESSVCRKQLASEDWLTVLRDLAKNGPSTVRGRIFILFRKMLPMLSPDLRNGDETNTICIERFLLDSIACVFEPQTCQNPDKTFSVACEAAHTLRVLLLDEKWNRLISGYLCHALQDVTAFVKTFPSMEDSDVGTKHSANADGSEDEESATVHSGEESALPQGLAAMCVISKTLRKLYPGSPVQVMHHECESGSGTIPASTSEDFILQRVVDVFVGRNDKKTLNVPLSQLQPMMDGSFEDIHPFIAKDTLLLECILDFYFVLVERNPLTRRSCCSRYKIAHAPSSGSLNVYDSPDVKTANKVGQFEQGDTIVSMGRQWQWIKLHEQHVKDFNSDEAWMILQDTEDDYLMEPVVSPCPGQDCQLLIGTMLAVSGISNIVKHPTASKLIIERILAKNNIESLINSSLMELRPGIGIPELSWIEERFCIILQKCFLRSSNTEATREGSRSRSNTVEPKTPTEDAQSNTKQKSSEPLVSTPSGSSSMEEAILQLVEMGFPNRWAKYALEQTNDVTAAITYICSNGDVLDQKIHESSRSARAEHDEAQKQDNDNDIDSDTHDDQTDKGVLHPGTGMWLRGRKDTAWEEIEADEDYMETDGMDSKNALEFGSRFVDNTGSVARADEENTVSAMKLSSRVASFPKLSRKDVVELEKKCSPTWGPCADSRASYQDLICSYSACELFEELLFVSHATAVLRVRVLLLSLFAQVPGNDIDVHSLFNKEPDEMENSEEKVLRLCVMESFRPYPLYSKPILISFCNGCNASELSIPTCLSSFFNLVLEQDSRMVQAVLSCIRSHIQVTVSADFLIGDHLEDRGSCRKISLWFVDWGTRILLNSKAEKLIHVELFKIWLQGLRSPSIAMKREALAVLSTFFDRMKGTSHLKEMVQLVPIYRLRALAARHLWKDFDDLHGFSKYTKALIQFVAKTNQAASYESCTTSSALSLGSQGYVEIRECSGGIPHVLQSPWTVSFLLRSNDLDQVSQPEMLLSPGKYPGQGVENCLQLLSKTNDGRVGIRFSGREYSFGYKLPENEMTHLTFTCEKLNAKGNPKENPRVRTSKLQETATQQISERSSEFSMSLDEDEMSEDYELAGDNGMEEYIQFLDLTKNLLQANAKQLGGEKLSHLNSATSENAFHVKLYANGSLVGSCTVLAGCVNLSFGEFGSSSGLSFSGNLFRLYIWRESLVACMVERLRNKPDMIEDPLFAKLVSYWDMSAQDQNGGVLIDNCMHGLVGLLRDDAKITTTNFSLTAPLVAQEPIQFTNYSLREVAFKEGIEFHGVLVWDLEKTPGWERLIIPRDFFHALRPIKLFLRSVGNSSNNIVSLQGFLEFRDCRHVTCEIQGSCDTKSGDLSFSVSSVVRGDTQTRNWAKSLRFKGKEKHGEVVGIWVVPFEIQGIPELSDGSPLMRIAPKWLVSNVDVYDGATRLRVGVNSVYSRLPSFVTRSNAKEHDWAVLILCAPSIFTVHTPDTIQVEQDTSQDADALTWACPACTYANELDHACCFICNTACPESTGTDDEPGGGCESDTFDGESQLSDGIFFRSDSGTYHWEFRVDKLASAVEPTVGFGICVKGTAMHRLLGSDAQSWCVYSDGTKWHNNIGSRFLPEGVTLKTGDVVGLELDTSKLSLGVFINNQEYPLVFEKMETDELLSPCISISTQHENSISIMGFKHGLFLNGQAWVRGKRCDTFEQEDSDQAKNEVTLKNISGAMTLSRHQLFTLDPDTKGPDIAISDDCLTAEYVSSGESSGRRNLVLGSKGFSSGVHYWEVHVQGMQWGSTYIGISETRPESCNGIGWTDGYGFVNYRATHGPDGEQLYGSFYAVGDVVGVLLDVDRGRIHFFKDGKDYQSGETKQTIVDLGLAYSRLRRRNVHAVFYPCFGLSKTRDRLSISGTHNFSKTSKPVDCILNEVVDSIVALENLDEDGGPALVEEAVSYFNKWHVPGPMKTQVYWTIAKQQIELSQSVELLGALSPPGVKLVQGLRLWTERGEAVVLGVYSGCVWYAVEGMEFTWFWLPSELCRLFKDEKLKVLDLGVFPSTNSSCSLLAESDIKAAGNLLNTTSWTSKHDALLVLIVNRCCDRQSCEPEQLQLDILQYAIEAAALESMQFASLRQHQNRFLLGRFLLLLALNVRMRTVLPFVDLEGPHHGRRIFIRDGDDSVIVTGTVGDIVGRKRGVIFTRVKLFYWEYLLELSTTPTVPAADEYDPPPDFPQIKVNRIRAGDHRLSALAPSERLGRSVFGQLMLEASKWSPNKLRRAYSHIQDASQQRCFFVKFESEGVDDHGGPYRAVFQIAIEEEAVGALGILIPCPNAAEGAMQNVDKVVFSTGDEASPKESSLKGWSKDKTVLPQDAAGNLECAHFLGRLVGIAVRHRINVGLSLPSLVWRPLVLKPVGWRELHEIDSFTTRSLRRIETLSRAEWEESQQLWSDILLDKLPQEEQECAKLPVNSKGERWIPYEKRQEFTERIVKQYLSKGSLQFKAFATGLSDVLPVDCFRMFTADELEALVCGSPEIDVGLLKQATVYENVDPDSPHIQYFWEALEEMNQDERAKFINFVCARSRLPSSVDKFPMNFKILPPVKKESDNTSQGGAKGGVDNEDMSLPHSQTCFFSLSLPKYSSKKVCMEKLIYAANNCNTMEDFDDHDAEGFQGM